MRSSRSALICTNRVAKIGRMRRATIVGLALALFLVGSATAAPGAPVSKSTKAVNGWPTRTVGATPMQGLSLWTVRANGRVTPPSHHAFFGDARLEHLAQPITGIAATPTGKGY